MVTERRELFQREDDFFKLDLGSAAFAGPPVAHARGCADLLPQGDHTWSLRCGGQHLANYPPSPRTGLFCTGQTRE